MAGVALNHLMERARVKWEMSVEATSDDLIGRDSYGAISCMHYVNG